MARRSYPKHAGPPPPALPPVAQTVGQLVAETLRLYGARFLAVLPLGLPLAIADQFTREVDRAKTAAILAGMSPAFTAAYVVASVHAHGARPSWRGVVTGMALGSAVFAIASPLLAAWVLGGVAWLALAGHVVPAAVAEGRSPVDAVRRSYVVAKADYLHALGGLATLVVLFYLTRILLEGLLRSQADNTVRVAVLLSDVVLSPIILLGGALLYTNLASRVGVSKVERRAAREKAMAEMRGQRR